MTALSVTIEERRAAYAERLAAHTAEAKALAGDLALLQYADVTLLGTDRTLLRLGGDYAEEVRANVLALGIDPEAGE